MQKAERTETQSSPVISQTLGEIVHVRDVQSWSELVALQDEQFANPKEIWIFRGLRSANWDLETTLERAVRRFDAPGSRIEPVVVVARPVTYGGRVVDDFGRPLEGARLPVRAISSSRVCRQRLARVGACRYRLARRRIDLKGAIQP